MAELLHLTFVQNEAEAEMLCGLLRTEGIECAYRQSIGVGNLTGGGTQEILVEEAALDRAQSLLAAPEDT